MKERGGRNGSGSVGNWKRDRSATRAPFGDEDDESGDEWAVLGRNRDGWVRQAGGSTSRQR